MRKISVAVLTMSLVVSMAGLANAGCGNCAQQQGGGMVFGPMQKFYADTIDMRQEMMTKRFDLQRENLKALPDAAKVALLQADIKTLQARIQNIRNQSGLPGDKCDGECNQKMGQCDKKNMGDCGKSPCGNRK